MYRLFIVLCVLHCVTCRSVESTSDESSDVSSSKKQISESSQYGDLALKDEVRHEDDTREIEDTDDSDEDESYFYKRIKALFLKPYGKKYGFSEADVKAEVSSEDSLDWVENNSKEDTVSKQPENGFTVVSIYINNASDSAVALDRHGLTENRYICDVDDAKFIQKLVKDSIKRHKIKVLASEAVQEELSIIERISKLSQELNKLESHDFQSENYVSIRTIVEEKFREMSERLSKILARNKWNFGHFNRYEFNHDTSMLQTSAQRILPQPETSGMREIISHENTEEVHESSIQQSVQKSEESIEHESQNIVHKTDVSESQVRVQDQQIESETIHKQELASTVSVNKVASENMKSQTILNMVQEHAVQVQNMNTELQTIKSMVHEALIQDITTLRSIVRETDVTTQSSSQEYIYNSNADNVMQQVSTSIVEKDIIKTATQELKLEEENIKENVQSVTESIVQSMVDAGQYTAALLGLSTPSSSLKTKPITDDISQISTDTLVSHGIPNYFEDNSSQQISKQSGISDTSEIISKDIRIINKNEEHIVEHTTKLSEIISKIEEISNSLNTASQQVQTGLQLVGLKTSEIQHQDQTVVSLGDALKTSKEESYSEEYSSSMEHTVESLNTKSEESKKMSSELVSIDIRQQKIDSEDVSIKNLAVIQDKEQAVGINKKTVEEHENNIQNIDNIDITETEQTIKQPTFQQEDISKSEELLNILKNTELIDGLAKLGENIAIQASDVATQIATSSDENTVHEKSIHKLESIAEEIKEESTKIENETKEITEIIKTIITEETVKKIEVLSQTSAATEEKTEISSFKGSLDTSAMDVDKSEEHILTQQNTDLTSFTNLEQETQESSVVHSQISTSHDTSETLSQQLTSTAAITDVDTQKTVLNEQSNNMNIVDTATSELKHESIQDGATLDTAQIMAEEYLRNQVSSEINTSKIEHAISAKTDTNVSIKIANEEATSVFTKSSSRNIACTCRYE